MTTPQPPAPPPAGRVEPEARPGGGFLEGDWPVRATDTIERLVEQARSKTTGPAIVASRWIVYGVVAAFLGVGALVLLIVATVRGLDILIPGDVWIVYLILGLVFALAGALLWRKRSAGRTA